MTSATAASASGIVRATCALIGSRVGHRSLAVTADTYMHVLLDDRELDHVELAGQLGT